LVVSRYAPLLALSLTLAGFAWHDSPRANAIAATPSSAGAMCGAADVRRTVVRFAAASNSRERRALDHLIARDGLFLWFTIDDRDPRRSAGFYERGPLLRYLAGRRGGAKFRLLSFAFNGRGDFHGHFDYRLAVTSRSVRLVYRGKGAVTCTTPHRIAVWSMGNT